MRLNCIISDCWFWYPSLIGNCTRNFSCLRSNVVWFWVPYPRMDASFREVVRFFGISTGQPPFCERRRGAAILFNGETTSGQLVASRSERNDTIIATRVIIKKIVFLTECVKNYSEIVFKIFKCKNQQKYWSWSSLTWNVANWDWNDWLWRKLLQIRCIISIRSSITYTPHTANVDSNP